MRANLLLVTRIPFWRLGAGERMRLLALVWVLGQHSRLTIFFLGPLGHEDRTRIAQLRITCVMQACPAAKDKHDEWTAFKTFVASHSFDVCIFERLELHFLHSALPAGVRSAIDTHDLESVNADSRREQGLSVGSTLCFDDELAMLASFDKVLLIQTDDHQRVLHHLGSRAMLVPHPVSFAPLAVQSNRRRIGLVASAWAANLDGMDWFSDQVWPHLDGHRCEMHLLGWIGDRWRPGTSPYIRHGYIADFKQAWGTIDVAINPVRWGSGLKIKSVEALGHGLPLVTTSEGARGMPTSSDEVFLRADDPKAFAENCIALLDDTDRRASVGAAAFAYSQLHFSPRTCFAELVQWLNSGVSK